MINRRSCFFVIFIL